MCTYKCIYQIQQICNYNINSKVISLISIKVSLGFESLILDAFLDVFFNDKPFARSWKHEEPVEEVTSAVARCSELPTVDR